jgi:hypothetical protein
MALVCLSAAAGVLGSTLASRAAGPVAGGVAAAFPTMSGTLAVAVTAQGSRSGGADVLTGLVRSLPCFFAFALTIAICARHLGLWSFATAATAAVTAAALTWHHTNTPAHTRRPHDGSAPRSPATAHADGRTRRPPRRRQPGRVKRPASSPCGDQQDDRD